jgi:glycopeptide antibiotics resistance protein
MVEEPPGDKRPRSAKPLERSIRPLIGGSRRWRVTLGLLVLATLEELSQMALPRRTFDLGDLAMNILGISIFGLAAVVAARLRRRSPRCNRPRYL